MDDFNHRLEVTNAFKDTAEIVVTAKCDGDYNKTGLPDPLYLDFHFALEGGTTPISHSHMLGSMHQCWGSALVGPLVRVLRRN